MMDAHWPTPSYPSASRSVDDRVSAEQPMTEPSATRARKTPRLVAAGFLGAFALSILTVVLTGLWVRAPGSRGDAAPTQVSLEMNRERTVNLLFSSRMALDGVTFTIDLPYGVEVRGHEGRSRLEWSTRLQWGNNLLPLPLVATAGRGGPLVARLRHAGREKVFLVNLAVGAG
jgi:hypothetical protein